MNAVSQGVEETGDPTDEGLAGDDEGCHGEVTEGVGQADGHQGVQRTVHDEGSIVSHGGGTSEDHVGDRRIADGGPCQV